MKNTFIPETLPSHGTPFYSSTAFFDESTKKMVNCYFHASNRGWLFPIAMHSHEFYEVNLIVGGQGIHYINNQRINIEAGDVFILPPNHKHGYFEINNLEIFHILINHDFFTLFKKNLKLMNGFDSLFNIEPIMRGQTTNAFLRLSKEQFDNVLTDVNNIMQYPEENIYHHNIQTAIVFSLISKFCTFHQQSLLKKQVSEAKNSYVPLIIFSIEYMKKNLSQKLTNETIAEILSISPATFKKHFKEITKTPPMEYFMKLRINQSKKLLKTTNESLLSIAMACGFFDTAHFFRQFKKFENMSPSEYRKRPSK